jgi:hypothetical protein
MYGRASQSPLGTAEDITFGRARHPQRVCVFQFREELPTLGEQSATAGDEVIRLLDNNSGTPPRLGRHLRPTIDFGLVQQSHLLSVNLRSAR